MDAPAGGFEHSRVPTWTSCFQEPKIRAMFVFSAPFELSPGRGERRPLVAGDFGVRAAGVMRIPIEAVIRTRVPRLAAKAMQILNSAAIRR